ncbi:hypothetical protein HPB48_021928 [Haemaphysalis longicornis]|uniref:Uncharacterized protein n=1 Tax=Haemaphysalis longicornis TaxID=44386 RepID=A0A9J6FLF5_HAELO|nr:hypothetical protein HPB48_021928 [Haemaphysalis longicornis]
MYARRHPAEDASFLMGAEDPAYRQRKPGDLLGILVDLSVNWDIHIWFRMRIALRSRNTSAVHIGRSQSLADWAAMVKGIRNTRKYNRGIEKVLGLLDLPREQQRETLSRVMALENLISAALGNSPVNEEPLVDRLETMAALLTPSIHATSWLDAVRSVQPPGVNITLGVPVRVVHPSVLRALSHLLDLGPRMQDAVAEHIVYRTILEVGWMVDDRNRRHQRLDSKPDTAAVKCLHHVKNMVGLAWFSLFPASNGDRRVKLSVLGSLRPTLQLLTGIAAPSESSIPADVLPPLQASFFANWVTYKQARLELLSRGLYNVLGVDGVADGSWNQELNSTAEPLIFSYPFFHSDLHPIVNYAGAGRLLARSVLGLTMSNAFLSLEAAAVKAARHALEESGETTDWPQRSFLEQHVCE